MPGEIKEKLKTFFGKNGIVLTDLQSDQFASYFLLLTEWNEKFNLTAITELEDVIVKHFYDSCVCASIFKQNASIIDVGCGAGFPSIPLKILRPDLNLTLIDSVNKKLIFINELILKLQLDNVITIHSRAEDLAFKENFRQNYDYCVSRAVASLNTLCEYCLPFVKLNGEMIAYKSVGVDEELENAKNAIKILGGKLEAIKDYKVLDYSRKVVIIKKLSETPKKYPRPNNKPRTSPLA